MADNFFESIQNTPGGFTIIGKMFELAGKHNLNLFDNKVLSNDFVNGFKFGIYLAKELINTGEFTLKEGNAGE